jgi:hypothetical protein
MSKLPNKKRIATKAKRKLDPHDSQSRGRAMREKPPVEDQKTAADDIRRAVDDGMQDLRTK